MASSRRDLPNNMAKQKFILKKKRTTPVLFSHQNRNSIPPNGCFVLTVYCEYTEPKHAPLTEAGPEKDYWFPWGILDQPQIDTLGLRRVR